MIMATIDTDREFRIELITATGVMSAPVSFVQWDMQFRRWGFEAYFQCDRSTLIYGARLLDQDGKIHFTYLSTQCSVVSGDTVQMTIHLDKVYPLEEAIKYFRERCQEDQEKTK